MKKILTSILIALTAVFALSTSEFVKADSLIDLYPREDADFALEHGNSNWIVEFTGHRFHMARRSTRHLSNLEGVDDIVDDELRTVYNDVDMPTVQYGAHSGIIINDLERDIIIQQENRINLGGGVNDRFWAYFDEQGRLAMYEDEFINYNYITKVENQDYWQLSTEAEIALWTAAPEEEKPENIMHTPIRILINEDRNGYKAEPVQLNWVLPDQSTIETDPEDPEATITVPGYQSVVTGIDSRHIRIPAGWTVLHFGEFARNASTIAWAATFPELIAAASEEVAEFIYIDRPARLMGLAGITDNPQSEIPVVIVEYNGTADINALIKDVSANYIDKEDDIKGNGELTHFKNISYTIEVFDGETLIETIEVLWDQELETYSTDANLDFVDSRSFGKEYNLVYKAVSPLDENLTVEELASITVGVLPPQITGVKDLYFNIGEYFNPLDGLTARDPQNDRDITNTLVFNHGQGFNPNNLTYGRHNVSVTASWLYEEPIFVNFRFPEEILADPEDDNPLFAFDDVGNTIDFPTPQTASRPPAVYTYHMKEQLVSSAALSQITAWGRGTAIVDSEGTILTVLNTWLGAIPKVLDGEGNVVDMVDYAHAAWINTYLTEGTFLIHTHGAATSAQMRLIQPGQKLVDLELNLDHFETVVSTTEEFVVNVADSINPEIFVFKNNLTIRVGEFENARDAALSNVIAIDNDSAILSVLAAVNRIDITVPGVHQVSVVATDPSGNEVTETFTLTVVEAEDFEELATELEDKIAQLEADLDAKLEDQSTGTSVVVTIIIAVVAAGLSFGGAVLFLGKRA